MFVVEKVVPFECEGVGAVRHAVMEIMKNELI